MINFLITLQDSEKFPKTSVIFSLVLASLFGISAFVSLSMTNLTGNPFTNPFAFSNFLLMVMVISVLSIALSLATFCLILIIAVDEKKLK